MKKYDLGATDLRQYESLTDDEREAWLHPQERSYHSFHVERMGRDTWRWRDSRTANFYIGTLNELQASLVGMQLRKLDPDYQQHITAVRLLSQDEIDDMFADL